MTYRQTNIHIRRIDEIMRISCQERHIGRVGQTKKGMKKYTVLGRQPA